MTLEEYLEQYNQLLGELQDIEKKLGELASSDWSEQTDAVQGSSAEESYTKLSVTLHGFVQSPSTVRKRNILVNQYDAKLGRLYEAIAIVESFLDRITDVKARRIIRMRYIDCMEWQDISVKLGGKATEGSIKMYALIYPQSQERILFSTLKNS